MSTLRSLNPDQHRNTISVEIWSDVVCPFCYIGKRNFENALNRSGLNGSVDIIWRSFELAPDAETAPARSIYEILAKRKGWSLEQSEQIHRQMEERARQAGLKYDFDNTIPANSRRAHRLLHLAKKKGVQDATKERLFRAYFTLGENIDDPETLVTIGSEAGLDNKEILHFLESEEADREINEDILQARRIGVQGVPFFVLNQTYAVSGAQPVHVFVDALEKVKEELNLKNRSDSAAGSCVCSPEGNCS